MADSRKKPYEIARVILITSKTLLVPFIRLSILFLYLSMRTSTTSKNALALQVTLTKKSSEDKFTERKSTIQKNNEVRKKILHRSLPRTDPALPNHENILMSKWHLIQNKPLLRKIYNEPPIISYKRAKSQGDILVKAKQ